MVNAGGVIRVGRRELYERVWTTPMVAVCRDYGISNVGLAKVCKRHKIPCPPRGYWARKHSGQAVRRTPLPACPVREAPGENQVVPALVESVMATVEAMLSGAARS